MREPIHALMGAIERDSGGIAIVWCPDLGLREWLVDEVEALVPSNRRAFRTSSLEAALAAPERLALLVPDDEEETVLDLDGSRDRLRNPDQQRTQPIVLFLLRAGDGAEALARHGTSLWSIAGGNDVDPERLAEIDVGVERQRFLDDQGVAPETWLEEWRSGELPQNAENFAKANLAVLLETR